MCGLCLKNCSVHISLRLFANKESERTKFTKKLGSGLHLYSHGFWTLQIVVEGSPPLSTLESPPVI